MTTHLANSSDLSFDRHVSLEETHCILVEVGQLLACVRQVEVREEDRSAILEEELDCGVSRVSVGAFG